jgi:hypothetical protein
VVVEEEEKLAVTHLEALVEEDLVTLETGQLLLVVQEPLTLVLVVVETVGHSTITLLLLVALGL